MKYKKTIIMSAIFLLIVLIGVNRCLSSDITQIYESDKACIMLSDKRMDPLIDRVFLEGLDTKNIDVVFQRQVGSSKELNFEGVLLKDILAAIDIEIESIALLEVLSVDNYKVELSKEEVLHDDNVYLVYRQDGDYLSNLEAGGIGPFMMVIKEDKLSTRWAKYVSLIRITEVSD